PGRGDDHTAERPACGPRNRRGRAWREGPGAAAVPHPRGTPTTPRRPSPPGRPPRGGPRETARSRVMKNTLRKAPARTLRPRAAVGRSGISGAGRGSAAAGVPAAQVALELAGDRVAARLGQLGGVLLLLERADVVGDLGVLLGELVDAVLPRAGLLRQLAERDGDVQEVLDAAQQREG